MKNNKTKSESAPRDALSMKIIKSMYIAGALLLLSVGTFYLGTLTKQGTIKQQASQLAAQKTDMDKINTANQQANAQLKTVTDSYSTLKSNYDAQTANIRAGKYNTVQTQYVPTYQAPTYTYKPYNSGTVTCDTQYYDFDNSASTTCR